MAGEAVETMIRAPAPPSYTPRHCAARLRLTEGGLRPLRGRFARYSVPRRGGRAVECGGLENRFGPLGPTRVQIPPPPLNRPGGTLSRVSGAARGECGARLRRAGALAGQWRERRGVRVA